MNLGIVLGIIGILASLIGIPVAFIVARRTRQLPDLRHAINFDVILNPDDRLLGHGLSMQIGDRPINSISRSRVALWNHRGDTIRGGDIVDSDPLRIEFGEGDIALQARILSTSRPQTRLTPTIDVAGKSSVNLTFDFLDAGDGAIFEIVHLGPEKPVVLGTIRGTKIGNYGDANLGSKAIEVIRKPRLLRFLNYSPLRVRINVCLCLLLAFIFAVFAIALAIAATGHGHLVPVGHYNLRTISGQAGFSNAVVSSGNPHVLPYILFAVTVACASVYYFTIAIRTFVARSKRIVPKSVVAFIVDR